jgi:hypothetical protein
MATHPTGARREIYRTTPSASFKSQSAAASGFSRWLQSAKSLWPWGSNSNYLHGADFHHLETISPGQAGELMYVDICSIVHDALALEMLGRMQARSVQIRLQEFTDARGFLCYEVLVTLHVYSARLLARTKSLEKIIARAGRAQNIHITSVFLRVDMRAATPHDGDLDKLSSHAPTTQ